MKGCGTHGLINFLKKFKQLIMLLLKYIKIMFLSTHLEVLDKSIFRKKFKFFYFSKWSSNVVKAL